MSRRGGRGRKDLQKNERARRARLEILDDVCGGNNSNTQLQVGLSYGLRERLSLERHGENIAQTAMASNYQH